MKIVIDARMLYATGIGRYVYELLDGLQRLDHDNQYVALIRPQDRGRWIAAEPNFSIVEVDAPIYSLAEQTKLPGILRNLGPDLVHFTNFNSPVAYAGRRITTVHDLTLLDFSTARGSIFKRASYQVKRVVLKYQIRNVLRKSAVILTDAEYVRGDLIKRGLATAERSRSIYLGVPSEVSAPPTSITDLTGPFLLHVGNFYPYKNLRAIIEALPAIRQTRPALKLVLAGKNDDFGDELKALAAQLGLADSVIFTGFVSDGELAWLYQNAKLYVLPSLSEGFGLPGLAAMSQGLPVVASKATCLPEILGEGAIYFDPCDTHDIAHVIGQLLEDPAKLKALQTAGTKHVKDFSWKRMAEQTLAVYKDALK